MYTVKVIKTEAEHKQALARLMELMDSDPAEGSAAADELELLALVIDQFESAHYPMDPPDPIEAIKFRMDQVGLKSKDLVPFIGSASKVSEVLSHKRPLSLNMIRKLNQGLGIPAEVLVREPVQALAQELDIDWRAFPLAEMLKRGYFPEFSGTLAELKEYAAEQVGRFLSVVDGFRLKPAWLRTTAHIRSNDKETDSYALWAWQARVMHRVACESLPDAYDPGLVTPQWMTQLARLSWSDNGPMLAKEYLNKSGIHFIIEPHLPKTYLDGAVFIASDNRPVVAMTLRHDRLDNFWFTLMHELAHVALHIDGGAVWYLDNELVPGSGVDEIEQQADSMALECLIPKDVWAKALISSADDVQKLARQLSISPSIVAGRVCYERNDYSLFGGLFRKKVNLQHAAFE